MAKRRQGRIETYPSADGWRTRVVAGNGQIVLPQEGHTRPGDAERAMRAAMRILASNPPIIRLARKP